MKVISTRALRDRMCEYFHEVEATGEELLVTEDGELVLKIISYQRYSNDDEPAPKDRCRIQ